MSILRYFYAYSGQILPITIIMKRKGMLQTLEVSSPCTEDWNQMCGDQRSRFCARISRDKRSGNIKLATEKAGVGKNFFTTLAVLLGSASADVSPRLMADAVQIAEIADQQAAQELSESQSEADAGKPFPVLADSEWSEYTSGVMVYKPTWTERVQMLFEDMASRVAETSSYLLATVSATVALASGSAPLVFLAVGLFMIALSLWIIRRREER